MTNVSTSLDVFFKPDGLMMLGFGTIVGGAFALLIFAISVLGIPMLLDRDVDFITAMLRSGDHAGDGAAFSGAVYRHAGAGPCDLAPLSTPAG